MSDKKKNNPIQFRVRIADGYADAGEWEYFDVEALIRESIRTWPDPAAYDWPTMGLLSPWTDQAGAPIYEGDILKGERYVLANTPAKVMAAVMRKDNVFVLVQMTEYKLERPEDGTIDGHIYGIVCRACEGKGYVVRCPDTCYGTCNRTIACNNKGTVPCPLCGGE